MSDVRLPNGLSLAGSDLFLKGERIFTVPTQNAGENGRINVAGSWGMVRSGSMPYGTRVIFVGTGSCCNGHLYKLVRYGHKERGLSLENIFTPELCIQDIYPVSTDYKKTGFGNRDGMLVCGHGCAGAGVRLLATYWPRTVDIVSTAEYHAMLPTRVHIVPRFRPDSERKTVFLELMRAGLRPKEGRRRNPELPDCVGDVENEEWYVNPSDIVSSVDLGPRLAELGADLALACTDETRFARVHPW